MPSRVAIFIGSLSGTGVPRVAFGLASGLVEQGLLVDLVVADGNGELSGEIPGGVRLIDLKASRMVRAAPALINYLRHERPVSLVSSEDHANILAIWARRLSGYPERLVVTCHVPHSMAAGASLMRKAHWMKHLVRTFYSMADAVVTVSDGLANDMAKTTGFPRERITVVHNPVVTPSLLENAKGPCPHPWFESPEPPVILGVGSLRPRKGFDKLIRAFAVLRANRPARLMIVGSGPAEVELRKLAESLGVSADVNLVGFAANPFSYMSRSSLFVLSSTREGLPTVLIEAMACGCPVVSTDCLAGPSEILDGGRHGPLVPVDDVEAMADAMLATLDNPRDSSLLKERASDFHVDKIVHQYRKLMDV